MLTFKSMGDLDQLSLSNPCYDIVEKLMISFVVEGERSGYSYDPATQGYVIYVQEEDLDSQSQDVWNEQALIETLWEGVHREGDYYISIHCPNNSFALIAVIPEGIISAELRAVLEDNLVPVTADLFD